MIKKHSELLLLGIVSTLALIGLFFIFSSELTASQFREKSRFSAEPTLLFQDKNQATGNNFFEVKRSKKAFRGDAASAQHFIPVFGGRGRRYIEDAG